MTAVERLIVALAAFATTGDTNMLASEMSQVQDALKAEQTELDALKANDAAQDDAIAGLKAADPTTLPTPPVAVDFQPAIDALTERVAALENAPAPVAGEPADLTALEGQVTDLETRTTALEARNTEDDAAAAGLAPAAPVADPSA